MKIEQLLVQHLYSNKKVSLQGIGTLSLDPSAALPAEGDKDFVMPANAITFNYDLKTGEDGELVNYIVEKTRKIKPLAMSDLESYSMLAKQFLNIGNPFLFEGIGNLVKTRSGEFALTAVPGMQEKTKEHMSVEKTNSPGSGEFHNDYKKIFYAGKIKMKWRKPFAIILILAGLVLLWRQANRRLVRRT